MKNNLTYGVLYLNLNSDKSIKSTDILNVLSKSFRECSFQKTRNLKEGFEINPIDFVWEYQIKFGKSLIVFRERVTHIEYWVYLDGENDIQPIINSICKTGISLSDKTNFCKLIRRLVSSVEGKNLQKRYTTINGIQVVIDRPDLVRFIEKSTHSMNYNYQIELCKMFEDGHITKKEFSDVIQILD